VPTAIELRELDDEELENRLGEYRRELLNLRFQLATGQLDNVSRVAQVRKDVARVLTVLRDREIALAEGREDEAGPVTLSVPRRRPRPAFDAAGFQEELKEDTRRRRRRREEAEADEAGDDDAEAEDGPEGDVEAGAEGADDAADEVDEVDEDDGTGDDADEGEG